MTRALKLWEAHRYDEAISECERGLAADPGDIGLTATLAHAFYAKGEYEKALPLLDIVDKYERSRKPTPGHPGQRLAISCAHWLLGDRPQGMEMMRRVVEDSLTGRIQYGDAAGGVTQGLLLYYMGTSLADPAAHSLALKYLRNRAKRSRIELWPGPVARYYLGEIAFDEVLVAATRHSNLAEAVEAARTHLLRRRQLCGALFHDGAMKRAQGFEEGGLQHAPVPCARESLDRA